MDKQKYWFFGSKLNTVLLVILIILMIIALRFMYKNKDDLPLVDTKQQVRDVTILQKGNLELIPWSTVISDNQKIYYNNSWKTTGNSDDRDSTTFTLPSGAIVFRGGRQSGCIESSFDFEYGVSDTACVKGLRADITHTVDNNSTPLTLEEKKAFGDFVLKNK